MFEHSFWCNRARGWRRRRRVRTARRTASRCPARRSARCSARRAPAAGVQPARGRRHPDRRDAGRLSGDRLRRDPRGGVGCLHRVERATSPRPPAHRRIRDPAYEGSPTPASRSFAPRDECLAEREYVSLLRRLVQGRAEILKAELTPAAPTRTGSTRRPAGRRSSPATSSPAHRGRRCVGFPRRKCCSPAGAMERLVGRHRGLRPVRARRRRARRGRQAMLATEEERSRRPAAKSSRAGRRPGRVKRRYKDDPSLSLR